MRRLRKDQLVTAARVRAQLVAAFPACFAAKGQPKKPLKIGLHRDLEGRLDGVTQREVRLALDDYCSGWTYLSNMVEGASRVDLAGRPCGIVDAQAAKRCKALILAEKHRQVIKGLLDALNAAHPVVQRAFLAVNLPSGLGSEIQAAKMGARAVLDHVETAIRETEAML